MLSTVVIIKAIGTSKRTTDYNTGNMLQYLTHVRQIISYENFMIYQETTQTAYTNKSKF